MIENLKRKHLLVTGGAGFMGSAFIRYVLNEAGFEGILSNLDLLTYAGNLENLSDIQDDPRYQFFQGDIADLEKLKGIHAENPIDAIVHFAAETHVDRSIEAPNQFIETNVFGTAQLLNFVRAHPRIHFHHISTDEVYGALGKSGLFTENSPYLPNSPYAASKAASDHFVRAYYKTYGISATLSHASNNYGPCQFPEKFIPLMILNCLEEKPLPVYGHGENVREWLYVDDHAAAIWAILEKGRPGEVYNIAGGQERRNIELLHDIIELLAEKTGKDPAVYRRLIMFVNDRLGHDFRYALEAKKIKEEIGWEPQNVLRSGLKKTIDWYSGVFAS